MGPSAENRENEQLVYSQEGSRASTELAQSLQIDISEIGPNNLTAKEQEAEGNVAYPVQYSTVTFRLPHFFELLTLATLFIR